MADEANAHPGATASTATSLPTEAAGSAITPLAAPVKGRRRGMGSGLRKSVEIVFFVTPALLVFLVFVVWPVVKAIQYSLFSWKGYGPLVDFVGLRNYLYVLKNEVFQDALAHNLIIVVLSIAIQLPLGLAIALLLNRKIRGQGLLRTIVFVPFVLSEVIAGVIWRQLLTANYGLIETVLRAVGIPTPVQGFLGDTSFALGAVMVVLTWKSSAWPSSCSSRGSRVCPPTSTRQPRSTARRIGRCSAGSPSRCSARRCAPGSSCP